MSRAERERDLVTYYSNEIQARVERDLPEPRVARRTAYLDQLGAEGRDTVLELGCGPGRDGEAIAEITGCTDPTVFPLLGLPTELRM